MKPYTDIINTADCPSTKKNFGLFEEKEEEAKISHFSKALDLLPDLT